MSIFLVQVDQNNIPITDMGFVLIQACNFENWFRGESGHLLYLVNKDICSVDEEVMSSILEEVTSQ